MLNIQFVRDNNCSLDIEKVKVLINRHSKSLKATIIDNVYKFDERLIVFPETQKTHYDSLKKRIKKDITFLVTDVPYDNNYFFEQYENLVILSFYNWKYLTTLPKENGLLYWVCDIIQSSITESDIAHDEVTGCINDFLRDKDGIDSGMRHAGYCVDCLNLLQKQKLSKTKHLLLDDVRRNLDMLAQSSKWNKSIFEKLGNESKPNKLVKRKSLVKGVVNVLIASPSDAQKEREILLKELGTRFLEDEYEELTGYRVIARGWEQLASQTGYGQDIVNDLLLPNIDIVIGVLKHKLGTPTKHRNGKIRAESGTAEELYYALEKKLNDVLCMLYIYPIPPTPSLEDPKLKQITKEWKTLKIFKDKIEDKVLAKPYSSESELLDIVLRDLAKNIKTYFK